MKTAVKWFIYIVTFPSVVVGFLFFGAMAAFFAGGDLFSEWMSRLTRWIERE